MDLFTIALNTCHEMMTDRKYELDETQEFKVYKNGENKIMIICVKEDKLNVHDVKDCIKLLSENLIKHCIIIYNKDITPTAKNLLQNLFEYDIEVFKVNELQYNITKHRLYSPHIKLTKEHRNHFVKNYGVKIPIIFTTDVVSRYFNFKKDDIIKIDRVYGTVSYRIVK